MRTLCSSVVMVVAVFGLFSCSGSSGGNDAGGSGGGSGGGAAGGSAGGSAGGTAGGGAAGGGGGDDAGAVDAGDFSCAASPLPTTAPAMVTVTGVVKSLAGFSLEPLADVTIAAYAEASGTALATATSDDAGTFSLTMPTSGTPVVGYLKAQYANRLDTYYYPARPFAADGPVGTVTVFASDTIALVANIAGAAQDAGSGMAVVSMVDCLGKGVPGASFSVSPAGSSAIRYFIANFPSMTATATDQDGAGGVFNLPTGTVTFSASVGSTALRAHALQSRPDVVTQTVVGP